MKNAVFWDVTPCGSCKKRRKERCIASIIRVERISELGTMLAINSNRRTLRKRSNYVRSYAAEWDTRMTGGGKGAGICRDHSSR
jgi:hypothetical protein